jgi:hypothetical protein
MLNIYDKKYVYEFHKQIHMPTPFFRKISTVGHSFHWTSKFKFRLNAIDTCTKKYFIASYAACKKRAFRGLSDNWQKFKCISVNYYTALACK